MDPWCHKGHPTPSARLCLLHQCLEWGNNPPWEMGMGDRDGSAGIEQQQSSNPRCSKRKDFLRKQLKGKLLNPEG